MDNTENVERLMAPTIWVEKSSWKFGPENTVNVGISQDEPKYTEASEENYGVGFDIVGRAGVKIVHLNAMVVPKRFDLSYQEKNGFN